MACFSPLDTPAQFHDLEIQPQATPRLDPIQDGNFLSRADALDRSNANALTDLTDLPSNAPNPEKEDGKKRVARDKAINKELKLRSWESKKTRGFMRLVA